VASLTGPSFRFDGPFIDGMRLAEDEINAQGGIHGKSLRIEVSDDRGDLGLMGELLRQALGEGAPAVLAVGPGSIVGALRRDIERAESPVVLLGGDLFTPRALFRQVFQAGLPFRWQVPLLAGFVAGRFSRVVLATESGSDEDPIREVFRQAMAERGADLDATVTVTPGAPLDALIGEAQRADAVVFAGTAGEAARVADAIRRLPNRPQLLLSADGLTPEAAAVPPPPGTIAAYPHSWAGWANPIPWVATFRARFLLSFQRPPVGFEQEGYDAVRLLTDALRQTGGEGGDRLVRALESFRAPNREPFYSALPIRLGPDDHTLISENAVGLFFVSGDPAGPLLGGTPWLPIT
jgi:branched-chain amino acid transport system substrate-binding protein